MGPSNTHCVQRLSANRAAPHAGPPDMHRVQTWDQKWHNAKKQATEVTCLKFW